MKARRVLHDVWTFPVEQVELLAVVRLRLAFHRERLRLWGERHDAAWAAWKKSGCRHIHEQEDGRRAMQAASQSSFHQHEVATFTRWEGLFAREEAGREFPLTFADAGYFGLLLTDQEGTFGPSEREADVWWQMHSIPAPEATG